MANHVRDLKKEQSWRHRIERWRKSKLSVREFCRRKELSEPAFYSWRRTLVKRDRQALVCAQVNGVGAESATSNGMATRQATFLPVQIVAETPASALEVVLSNGRVVRVAPGYA